MKDERYSSTLPWCSRDHLIKEIDDELSLRSAAAVAIERNASLREAAHGSDLFVTLKNGLKKVTIQEEDGPQEYYVAEGDTLLDEDQLAIYAVNRERVEAARSASAMIDAAGLGIAGLAETNSQALVGVTQGGERVRWKPGTVLSYRVVRATFTSAVATTRWSMP